MEIPPTQPTESGGGLELPPPPPVSPPRSPRSPRSAHGEPPPGYEAPTIPKAKQFFKENLPRRVLDPSQPTGFRLARQGEENSILYSVWHDGVKTMDEFGVGVGLYFRQLQYLACMVLLCGVVYIPTVAHNADFNPEDTPDLLVGTSFGATRDDLSLAKNGVPDLIVTLILVLFAFTARKAEKKAVEMIDTAQQTAQDYTVCVYNPPGRSNRDPDMYKEMLSRYGEVVFVTVALDNGNLMKAVEQKRVLVHRLNVLEAARRAAAAAPPGGGEAGGSEEHPSFRTEADLKPWQASLQKYGLFTTMEFLERELEDVEGRLKGLAQRDYHPRRVYVTFNSERAQRKCLRACETGLLEEHNFCLRRVTRNEASVIDGRVVYIDEASEPSEVLWHNLHYSNLARVWRVVLSVFLCAAFLAATFFIVYAITRNGRSVVAAIFISLINASLPPVVRTITMFVEVHKSVTGQQQSMMLKLVLARMVNTAVLLFLSTPFEDRFGETALNQVVSILIADAFTTPVLRILNVWDLFLRTYVAPKARTQAEMNVFFQGAEWNLAERYTDMVKTIFVGLFYSAIVPTGIYVTAIAMVTLYWVDKYSLLRLWKRPPAYDATLASYARKYLALSIWVHLVMTRVFFAGWGLDSEPDCDLFTCDGDFSDEQAKIVDIYQVLGIVVFAVGGTWVLLWYINFFVGALFRKKHDEVGVASNVSFRGLPGADCYVPLVKARSLVDPLLAIDVSDLPTNAHKYLPLRVNGFYNPVELSMNSEAEFPDLPKAERNALFGTVKYYPAQGEDIMRPSDAGGFVYQTTVPAATTTGYTEQRYFGLEQAGMKTQAALFLQANAGGSVRELMGPRPGPPAPALQGYPEREAGIPAGWEERRTQEGRTYYVCHETRTTQWARPVVATGDATAARLELLDGWEQRFTPQGRPYYVDHNTRMTYWQLPQAAQVQHGHARHGSAGSATSGGGGGGGGAYGRGNGTIPQDQDAEASAAGRAFMAQYTSSGRKYFYNPNTQARVWSPPPGAGASAAQAGGQGGGGRGGGGPGGGGALPAGWEQRVTAAGRTYYANHDLRITQWEPPSASPTAGVAVVPAPGTGYGQPQSAAAETQGPVGGGWIEERVTPEGRPYWVDHRTQKTSWTRPPKAS